MHPTAPSPRQGAQRQRTWHTQVAGMWEEIHVGWLALASHLTPIRWPASSRFSKDRRIGSGAALLASETNEIIVDYSWRSHTVWLMLLSPRDVESDVSQGL